MAMKRINKSLLFICVMCLIVLAISISTGQEIESIALEEPVDWPGDLLTITRVNAPQGEYLIEVPDAKLKIYTNKPVDTVNDFFAVDTGRTKKIAELKAEIKRLESMDKVPGVLVGLKKQCLKAVNALTVLPRHASVTASGQVGWGG